MGAHSVSMLASASMCTAQHYQLLFRQRWLKNRRAEMHSNWFIWLVLDVFFFFPGGGYLCFAMRGLSVCVCLALCVCVGWQMFFQSNHENTSPTGELRWSRYICPHQQILYTSWIDSFFRSGPDLSNNRARHSFFFPLCSFKSLQQWD